MKLRLKKYKRVTSTNNLAIKLIKKKITKPPLIVAEKQSRGRGRGKNQWISKKGNLFFTIFFRLEQKINFKQFAILNAFFIKNIITKKFKKKIKIKWPNDLLFNSQKFCGILQEVVNYKQSNYLIVGIGLNTNIAPQNKGFQSTCLKNIIGKKIVNQKILKYILVAYEKFLIETYRLSFSELKRKYS